MKVSLITSIVLCAIISMVGGQTDAPQDGFPDFTDVVVNTFDAGTISEVIGIDSEPRVNMACVSNLKGVPCPDITGEELAILMNEGQERFGAEAFNAWDRPCQVDNTFDSGFVFRTLVTDFIPADDEVWAVNPNVVNSLSLTVSITDLFNNFVWSAHTGAIGSASGGMEWIENQAGARIFQWDRDFRVDPSLWTDTNTVGELVAPPWGDTPIVVEVGFSTWTGIFTGRILDDDFNPMTQYNGDPAEIEIDLTLNPNTAPKALFFNDGDYENVGICDLCLFAGYQTFSPMTLQLLQEACNCPDFDPECTIWTCTQTDSAEQDCYDNCVEASSCATNNGDPDFNAETNCNLMCGSIFSTFLPFDELCDLNCVVFNCEVCLEANNCDPFDDDCIIANCDEVCTCQSCLEESRCSTCEIEDFDCDSAECLEVLRCQDAACGASCAICSDDDGCPPCNCNIPLLACVADDDCPGCDGECPDLITDCIEFCEEGDIECEECCNEGCPPDLDDVGEDTTTTLDETDEGTSDIDGETSPDDDEIDDDVTTDGETTTTLDETDEGTSDVEGATSPDDDEEDDDVTTDGMEETSTTPNEDDSTSDDDTTVDGESTTPFEECPEGCGCDGKINYLKFRNNDALSQNIQITSKRGDISIGGGTIASGGEFDVSCNGMGCDNQNTLGTEIQIYIDGTHCGSIHTSCSVAIWVGQLFDMCGVEIEIREGTSRNTDTLCLADDDTCFGNSGSNGGSGAYWSKSTAARSSEDTDSTRDGPSNSGSGSKDGGSTSGSESSDGNGATESSDGNDSTGDGASKSNDNTGGDGGSAGSGTDSDTSISNYGISSSEFDSTGDGPSQSDVGAGCPDCVCDGKITYLKFEYTGPGCVEIEVRSNKGNYYSKRRMLMEDRREAFLNAIQGKSLFAHDRKLLGGGKRRKGSKNNDGAIFTPKETVCTGEMFEVDGSSNGQVDQWYTLGTEIIVFVGDLNVEIHTSCSQDIWIGQVFDTVDIVIRDGRSRNGGTLCTDASVNYGNCGSQSSSDPHGSPSGSTDDDGTPSSESSDDTTTTESATTTTVDPDNPFLECIPPCQREYVECVADCYGEATEGDTASDECINCCENKRDFCLGIDVCEEFYYDDIDGAARSVTVTEAFFQGTSGAVVFTIVPLIIVSLIFAFIVKYWIRRRKDEAMATDVTKMEKYKRASETFKNNNINDMKNRVGRIKSEESDTGSIHYKQSDITIPQTPIDTSSEPKNLTIVEDLLETIEDEKESSEAEEIEMVEPQPRD